MPTAALHLCPRCGPTDHDRCPIALQQRRDRAEQSRGTSTERGYDTSWRVLRVRALIRDSWTCQQCHWQPEPVRLAVAYYQDPPVHPTLRYLTAEQQANRRHLHVDHIQTIEVRPDLRLELDNLQTCLLYTSPSPRDRTRSRMPSSA